ncbi:MAG: threonylcarbamoyl-AMP synthase [Pseudomonadales bacterium]|nr:threonylcarbamoyl-AMP synthase [Pseudomonadales bacterium]
MGNHDLNTACEFLHQGKVIAYPTEAVWGFGCDPFCEEAVGRILTIKQRPVEKGLILVAADLLQISDLVEDLPAAQLAILESSWPGPTTWLIPDLNQRFPDWIKGTHDSIAIRVSAHPLVHALCTQFGKPVVSTSANSAGEEEIRSRLILEEHFADKIDYIVEGELGDRGTPSQIKDLVTGQVLR